MEIAAQRAIQDGTSRDTGLLGPLCVDVAGPSLDQAWLLSLDSSVTGGGENAGSTPATRIINHQGGGLREPGRPLTHQPNSMETPSLSNRPVSEWSKEAASNPAWGNTHIAGSIPVRATSFHWGISQ